MAETSAATRRDGSTTLRRGWVVRVRRGAGPAGRASSPGRIRSERTGFALAPTSSIEKPVRFFDTLTRAEDFNPEYLGMGTYVDWDCCL